MGCRMNDDCKWIWHGELDDSAINQWLNVRKVFEIDEIDPDACLHISVDTDYCLWLNGRLFFGGQFSDFPQSKHYDSLPVGEHLHTGRNCLAILAYYQGKSTFRYLKGRPGLIFSLACGSHHVVSDAACKLRVSPAYRNGPVPLVTPFLGLTMEYSAAEEDRWCDLEYDDQTWAPALVQAGATDGYWKNLEPRPLPKLEAEPSPPACVVEVGRLVRTQEGHSVAATIAADQLYPDKSSISTDPLTPGGDESLAINPPDKADEGVYVIVDLGREMFGHFALHVHAEKNTLIDFAHGEHLLDGRVRCCIDDRNFADRYRCAEGDQRWFMPMRRLGCRYLQLHFTCFSQPVRLSYAGLCPVLYPLAVRGAFECDNAVHNKIYEVARRTLHLSMHEHYEDCPWREQSLYAMDAQVQAIYGYYVFGEYDFPEQSLRLLGQSVRDDGFLDLCAPGGATLTIPTYSFSWISAVWQHCLYSGRTTLMDEFWQQIKNMLTTYLKLRDHTGLMPPLPGKKYWNYYEWSTGMDEGGPYNETPGGEQHACLNLILIEALDAAAEMGRQRNDPDADTYQACADELRGIIASTFVDKVTLLTRSKIGGDEPLPFAQVTQALALARSVYSDEQARCVRGRVTDDSTLQPLTLSMNYYLYPALLVESRKYGEYVLSQILELWGYMLDHDATTFWETIKGADDFDGCGSLSHPWAAVPVYIYQGWVLGIRPLSPGFQSFSVSPFAGDLSRAAGEIPTPRGPIKVEWERASGQIRMHVRHPRGLHPEIQLSREESPGWQITISSLPD
jgi:hypothetical protein